MNIDDIIRFMESHGFTFEAKGEEGAKVILHFSAPTVPAIIEVATPFYEEFELNEQIIASVIGRADCGCVYHAEQGIPCQHDLALLQKLN